MVQSVVAAIILADDHDRVRICGILLALLVSQTGLMEALREVSRRLDHAVFACCPHEWGGMTSEAPVIIVVLDTRVYHFLLAKGRQLVRAKIVGIVSQEGVGTLVASDGTLDPNNGRIVGSCLGSCWIPGAMTGKDLRKADTAMVRYLGRYLGWHGKIWRVLTPEMRYLWLVLIPPVDGVVACSRLSRGAEDSDKST